MLFKSYFFIFGFIPTTRVGRTLCHSASPRLSSLAKPRPQRRHGSSDPEPGSARKPLRSVRAALRSRYRPLALRGIAHASNLCIPNHKLRSIGIY
jgi:hypothetical protein